MICPLYTLLPMYQHKKIYIWNINKTSMILFTRIALMHIDIDGFVTIEKEYFGEMYMNRPVIGFSQVEKDENSIIIASEEASREQIGMLPKDRIVYWSDILGLNEQLRNEKIIIYGTGHGAEQIDSLLCNVGLEPEMYCVTKKEGIAWHKGKRVIEPLELENYQEYAVIISVKSEQGKKEILETLSAYPGRVYIEHLIEPVALFHMILFQNIDYSIKKQKKIYLYGKKDKISELIEQVLEIYGIGIAGYVDDRDRENDIKSIYSIAFDGIDDKFVIICEILTDRFVYARKNVELAGFSLEQQSYAGLVWYTASDDNLFGSICQRFDALVGMCYVYSGDKPGWKIYGRENNGVRILVLGGSTSSEVYCVENWVSKLYYKLKQYNIDSVIYNGAHPADDIVDEMMRLLRDISILKPDIVISMSGVNNLAYKESSNQFNETRMLSCAKSFSRGKEYAAGIASNESLFSFWNRNQQLIGAISNFYGAKFIGFLQPMNITMKHMNLREKSMFEMDIRISGAADFSQSECDYKYVNLMRLFEHQEDMFIDMAHYTDKAQGIIADKVFKEVMPIIQAMPRTGENQREK